MNSPLWWDDDFARKCDGYHQALLTVHIDLMGHRKSRVDIALYIERVLAELERSDECMHQK
jgi:hypothetical protein